MSERNTVVRSLHDLGLAVWLGGSLMGAVGLNGATREVSDRAERLRVANAGWARWTPVNAAAIGAHLVGGAGLLAANRGRVAAQKGVGASTVAKLGLTAAALGVTAWSRALGKKLEQSDGEPVRAGVEPAADTAADTARAQQQLRLCQWLVPALTAGLAVLNAVHGEQQRPDQQVSGILAKPAQLLGIGTD
jgi:enoyl-CoA hydratase/carnithine racemase